MKVLASEQDWQIVDDDGFVYKRARREEAAAIEKVREIEEEEEEEDEDELDVVSPQELLAQRRELLLKKKEMYATELRLWDELLSRQEEINAATLPPSLPSAVTDSPAIMLGEPHYEPYEELLQEIQDLEFFIQKYTSFCERAEDMVMLLNEKIKNHRLQQLRSPRQIFLETTTSAD
ncbi:hypothetical protein SELMODRAFT_438773 [Selaginella moellendorffii]|uniref:Uncharacterized protein n=1 Tax=Selaginella moellendorffii TaxID=88036 RepID=D8QZA3_SELML|nr:hypothetical protein SELMODRAFT_438773 [Selaginella moellendorffii]